MENGGRPPDPQMTEPVAVSDTVANGVSVYDDGLLCWLTFWAERIPQPGARPERVITSRVCVPSAQYARILRMMNALPGVVYRNEGDGHGLN